MVNPSETAYVGEPVDMRVVYGNLGPDKSGAMIKIPFDETEFFVDSDNDLCTLNNAGNGSLECKIPAVYPGVKCDGGKCLEYIDFTVTPLENGPLKISSEISGVDSADFDENNNEFVFYLDNVQESLLEIGGLERKR